MKYSPARVYESFRCSRNPIPWGNRALEAVCGIRVRTTQSAIRRHIRPNINFSLSEKKQFYFQNSSQLYLHIILSGVTVCRQNALRRRACF